MIDGWYSTNREYWAWLKEKKELIIKIWLCTLLHQNDKKEKLQRRLREINMYIECHEVIMLDKDNDEPKRKLA